MNEQATSSWALVYASSYDCKDGLGTFTLDLERESLTGLLFASLTVEAFTYHRDDDAILELKEAEGDTTAAEMAAWLKSNEAPLLSRFVDVRRK